MTSEERERFIADQLATVRRAVVAAVQELGSDDGLAMAMAHGWNAMRAAARRQRQLEAEPRCIVEPLPNPFKK